MKQVDIKSIVIPNKPRSGNYPVGSTVVARGGSGGSTTIVNQGGADLATLRQLFLSKKTDDTASGIITFLKGIKIASSLIRSLLKKDDKGEITDEAIMSALRIIKEIEDNNEKLKNLFLRKDIPDSTKHILSLFGGAVFGKDGFAEGLTGFGAKIGEDGRGEMRSLKVWEELIVPLLVYNRVDIIIGDKWRSPGAGVIESVTPDTDAEGNLLPSGTATLKLEAGELGAIAVDDMNMGIWHFGDERDATEDSDDGIGNFNFAGFTTAYWRITEIQDQENKTFRYVLRDGYNVHPQPQMKFSCRGNFTNEKRQTSVYETRTYTRMLWKQNDWEIGKRNIALQYGDLSNLNIFGINATGYAFYGNSLYFTGTVTQIREDGTEVIVANDRTDWNPGDFAAYYDRVSYEGELWICISKDGTNTIPSKDDPTWKLQVKSGKNIKDGGRWRTGLTVDEMTLVTMGGKAFISKVQTSNPPLWTVMDNFGNRILKSDGGYILTGEMNTDEYELIVENGADGKDAVTYEYIYQRTASQSAPSTPATSQTEGYVPSGWSAISQGVSDSYPYEWRCERKRSSAGIWSDWSNPSLVSSYGKQGLQGCVVRDSEWGIGVQYRNDSALTTNTGVRYIDVVLVRNDSTTTGWDAYQCKKTHVSSSSITYTNTEYWDKFDTNVGAIFTSLIIAKNAKIKFLSGNQLTIAHSQTGKPCLGLSGADESGAIRLWIGSETPDNAPFQVDEDGKFKSKDAEIEGTLSCKTFEMMPSDADIGQTYNNYLINYNNYADRKFPKIENGRVRKFEMFIPVTSRTSHEYSFIGEDDTVCFSIMGNTFTKKAKKINLPFIDGCYFNIIGVLDNGETIWNIFPIGDESERSLNNAELIN